MTFTGMVCYLEIWVGGKGELLRTSFLIIWAENTEDT